jgi:hypothetical protein
MAAEAAVALMKPGWTKTRAVIRRAWDRLVLIVVNGLLSVSILEVRKDSLQLRTTSTVHRNTLDNLAVTTTAFGIADA